MCISHGKERTDWAVCENVLNSSAEFRGRAPTDNVFRALVPERQTLRVWWHIE